MFFVILLMLSLAATASAKKKGSAGNTKKRYAKKAAVSLISRNPYIGAIVVDAASGRVLLDDNADATGYPASVTKLMTLLIILEKVEQGAVDLNDTVKITAEAARVGGSQAYLRAKEKFSVDDLLYAVMVKSANDAAAALAIHVAGSQEVFVQWMNAKAHQLGMTSTHFQSVNGLPPPGGRVFDESTARDISLLAQAVLKYPDTLRYTSTKKYAFRNGTFPMGNHNHLLGAVEGCDGLKTGYFSKAGFSIVATAQRNDVRIITVVLGSRFRHIRDQQAKQLLAKGFLMAPPLPEAAVAGFAPPMPPRQEAGPAQRFP